MLNWVSHVVNAIAGAAALAWLVSCFDWLCVCVGCLLWVMWVKQVAGCDVT